jgi:arylsulfatase A-like enzyme
VCSPTRATILTGRNHFRDCVDYVYGCSDMTECVPDFNFAPKRTFTVGDAVRAANKNYTSFFAGKCACVLQRVAAVAGIH